MNDMLRGLSLCIEVEFFEVGLVRAGIKIHAQRGSETNEILSAAYMIQGIKQHAGSN